jgi:hypothetical protein
MTEPGNWAAAQASVRGLLTLGAAVAMIVLGTVLVATTMCWTAGWRTPYPFGGILVLVRVGVGLLGLPTRIGTSSVGRDYRPRHIETRSQPMKGDQHCSKTLH